MYGYLSGSRSNKCESKVFEKKPNFLGVLSGVCRACDCYHGYPGLEKLGSIFAAVFCVSFHL